MTTWPKYPIIYELNAWTWLSSLSAVHGRRIELGSVPDAAWDAIAEWGADAVWLMGVWERSPTGVRIARQTPSLQPEYRRALPDFTDADVVGSPYCIHRYVADGSLGGPDGLRAAREALARRGLRLVLDFVPNHTALDHPWVLEHPEYYVQGSPADLAAAPGDFFEAGGRAIAFGRDPYFEPWRDTAQVNAFSQQLRYATLNTLTDIAGQCDGVRCDMAMLLINRVFEGTWKHRAGTRPELEYWRQVIRGVRELHPDFLFMAEAYWDLEWELQQQGFDYCYDKRLYDRLVHENAETVRLHLLADLNYQGRLVRFLENHDEPRAATTFPGERGRAAAVTILTLPGARLLHEGQFEGRRVKLPVQLGRRPEEPVDADLQAFYRKLLAIHGRERFRDGEWRLCDRGGWPDNQSFENLVAWCWRKGEDKWLVIVNLSGSAAHGLVRGPWEEVSRRAWQLEDLVSGAVYDRDGTEMIEPGLFVGLPAWGFHLLRFRGR